jgi:hypothetical protein
MVLQESLVEGPVDPDENSKLCTATRIASRNCPKSFNVRYRQMAEISSDDVWDRVGVTTPHHRITVKQVTAQDVVYHFQDKTLLCKNN